ncbi:MAG: hypothetical protein PVH11_01045 [Anaerolineae bacterium]|jgi:hypothetical protein
MSYWDVYYAEKEMDNNVRENVQQAQSWRLARKLNGGHQNWLSRATCCLGQRLAHWLIDFGRKLDQATLPPAEPLQET